MREWTINITIKRRVVGNYLLGLDIFPFPNSKVLGLNSKSIDQMKLVIMNVVIKGTIMNNKFLIAAPLP